jgi:hypothetical protein
MSRTKLIATLTGMIIGGSLFALIGGESDQVLLGGVSGTVMGAIVGYFAINNAVSRITVGAIIGASVFSVVGPGTDVPGLLAAPWGVGVGIVAGCLGWPWIFGVLGALVGLFVGAISSSIFCTHWPEAGPSPGQCELVGMLMGGFLTVVAGYFVIGHRPRHVDDENGESPINHHLSVEAPPSILDAEELESE